MNYLKYNLFIAILVSIVYVPVTWMIAKTSMQSAREERQTQIANNITQLSLRLHNYVKNGETLKACDALYVLQQFEVIDFYAFLSGDISCYQPERMKSLITGFEPGTKAYQFGEIPVAIARDAGPESNWALGARLPNLKSFEELMKEKSSLREAFFKDLLVVIYMFFGIMFFTVIASAKSIQNLYRSKNKNPLWLRVINFVFARFQPKDLQVLYSASEASIQMNLNLMRDKDLLETSLEQSVLNEIKENNHKIPYTFHGTVAKVDINGFSKVVSSGNSVRAHDLTRYLEDFGCELLQRYHGLFDKTVGDEIVVVFKGELSALFAVAFARDLMSEFSQIDFDLGGELRRFTLKSSISSSDIQFSKRAPGYGFNGDGLTYTSRLLDTVKEKDRNILACVVAHAESIKEIVVVPNESKNFEFKNMKNEVGYWIDSFLPIQEAYETKTNLLKYFRADSHLLFLMNQIRSEQNLELVDIVFDCFRKIKIQKCQPELISTWLLAIDDYTRRAQRDTGVSARDSRFAFSFAKLIMDGGALIPNPQWTSECSKKVLSIPRSIDGRINASVIDILILKDLDSIAKEVQESFVLPGDTSFRTRGNLLLSQALQELTANTFSEVLRMMNSANKLENSTGIFTACSIVLHYQKVNPAELEVIENYKELKSKLLHWRKNKAELSPRLGDLLDRLPVG